MIDYRLFDFKRDWPVVSKLVSPILCADTCGIMAYGKDGEFKACAIFDSFTVCACNVHMGIVSPMVLRHGFLPVVAELAFRYYNRTRIFGLTPENNVKARKFNDHIGMQFVAHIPDAYAEGVGYIVTKMERENSPWLKNIEEAA